MERIIIVTACDQPPNEEINEAIQRLRHDTGFSWETKRAFTIVETRTPLHHRAHLPQYKEYITTAILQCDDSP